MKKTVSKKLIWICIAGFVAIISIALFRNLSHKNSDSNEERSRYLYSIKNKYIGDSSADMRIINELKIAENISIEIKTNAEGNNILIINVNGDKIGNLPYEQYGAILLALIENASEIRFCINNSQNIAVTLSSAAAKYGNIKDYGKTPEKLHSFLTTVGYYKETGN